jgi:hypothetical protein
MARQLSCSLAAADLYHDVCQINLVPRSLHPPCTVDRLHKNSEFSDVDFAKMIQVETTCHLALMYYKFLALFQHFNNYQPMHSVQGTLN